DRPVQPASFAGDPKTGQPLQTGACRPEPGPSGCSDTDTATVATVEPRRAEPRRRRRRSAPARKPVRSANLLAFGQPGGPGAAGGFRCEPASVMLAGCVCTPKH